MSFFSRTDKSLLGSWWWTVDRVTLALLLTLCIFGVMLVAAASPPVAERNGDPANHFIIRHIIFLAPSMLFMIGLSMANLQQVWRMALMLTGIALFCMLLVPLIGIEMKGAQSWIQIGPL